MNGRSRSAAYLSADLRLVPAASAVWLVTWLGLRMSATGSFVMAGIAALTAGVALVLGLRGSAIVALAAGCAAAGALAVAMRVMARDGSPLANLARRHEAARLRVTVSDDPRLLAADHFGRSEVEVPATVHGASVSGQTWRLSAKVLVFAPAAGWRALLPSQRVTVAGQLAPARGSDLTVAVVFARGPPQDVGDPSLLQRVAGRLRAGLRHEAVGTLPAGVAGLVPGLVDGDVSGISTGLTEDFRTTGLTHLTAVSGANIAIVVGAVLLAVRWVGLGPRTSAALAGCALVGFVVLARPSPSVLRAAVMGGLALVGLASGRPKAAMPGLATALLVLVFVSPDLAGSPGFAMSVAASAALLLVAPVWTRALRRRGVPRGLAEALAVPAAAHLASVPLIAAISGQVSLVAIPANVLAEPAVAPATVLGVLAAVLAPISRPGGDALVWLAGWPARWIVTVAEHGARLPGAVLPWPGGSRGALLLALVVYGGGLAFRSRAARRDALATALGAGLVAIPIRLVAPAWPPTGWIFVACDVGQGDGLVLNAGAGSAVVVDTGPADEPIDACLRALGVRRVSMLVETHLDADHSGGVAGVFHGRTVGAVVAGPLREPPAGWKRVVAAAASRGLTVGHPGPGQRWRVGGLRLEVLGPAHPAHGTESDSNNSSLVIRASAGGHTILLTGDAGPEEQQALLADGVDLRADVLKVPHHGSAHNDPAFLAAVHARLAVISVGADNDYGQPAPSLLADLRSLGVPVDRTDEDGAIAVSDDAGGLTVATRH